MLIKTIDRNNEFLLVADSYSDLLNKLLTININIPPRGLGRHKKLIEIYSLVKMLRTLPEGYFKFPFQVKMRERPDFSIKLDAEFIGLEHTEAISKNLAKEIYLRSRGLGSEYYYIKRADLDEPSKSSRQITKEIEMDNNIIDGTAWAGNSVERGWALAMARFISIKILKTKKFHEIFDNHWLLIYDNWPAPALRHKEGADLLKCELSYTQSWDNFERIFILDERYLIELRKFSYIIHHLRE